MEVGCKLPLDSRARLHVASLEIAHVFEAQLLQLANGQMPPHAHFAEDDRRSVWIELPVTITKLIDGHVDCAW